MNELFIHNGSLSNSYDDLYISCVRQLCLLIKNKKVLPFLGAGISCSLPSNLPVASELKNPLSNCLKSSILKIFPEIPFHEKSLPNYILENSALENYLEVFKLAYRENYLDILVNYIDNKRVANINHEVLAYLSLKKFLPNIVTLNFDILIELAINKVGAACNTICPISNHNFLTGNFKDVVTTIIKPHGSFSSLDKRDNRAEFITTTIDSLGTRPNSKNSLAISQAIERCPNLLIAGYSDNDWDIFPILEKNSKKIESVFWVHYPDCDIKPNQRVQQWLEKFDNKSFLLIGDVIDLNLHISQKLKLPISEERATQCKGRKHVKIDAKKEFYGDVYKNLLALGLLLVKGSDKVYSFKIHKKLVKDYNILTDISLKYHALKGLSWSYHLADSIYHSIALDFKALRLISNNKINTDRSIGIDKIWIAFQFFSLIKPHRIFKFPQIIIFPIIYLIALIFKKSGENFYKNILSDKTIDKEATIDAKRKLAYSKHYLLELYHAWSDLVVLVFGKNLSFIRRPFFLFIQKKQIEIERVFYGFNKIEDGFWLRHLETLVFGGNLRNEKFEKYLSFVDSNIATNEIISGTEGANGLIYKSLLLSCKDCSDKVIPTLLQKSIQIWDAPENRYKSGLYRIMYVSRFMGYLTFINLVKYLFNNEKNKKLSDYMNLN